MSKMKPVINKTAALTLASNNWDGILMEYEGNESQ